MVLVSPRLLTNMGGYVMGGCVSFVFFVFFFFNFKIEKNLNEKSGVSLSGVT